MIVGSIGILFIIFIYGYIIVDLIKYFSWGRFIKMYILLKSLSFFICSMFMQLVIGVYHLGTIMKDVEMAGWLRYVMFEVFEISFWAMMLIIVYIVAKLFYFRQIIPGEGDVRTRLNYNFNRFIVWTKTLTIKKVALWIAVIIIVVFLRLKLGIKL